MEKEFILLIVFLLFLSFLCSGFETAFVSLDIDKIFLASSKYARKVFLKKPREILNTILLLNNLVNVSIAILFTGYFSLEVSMWEAIFSGAFFSFILIIIVGEFLPKYIASKFSFNFIKIFHPIIFIFYLIFSPFINLLTKIYNKFLKGEFQSKRDELLWLIFLKERKGIIPPEIGRSLKSSLYFSEKEVIEVLKPRTELFAINIDEPLESIKKTVYSIEYKKIPVYKNSVDNIIGYLLKKDILNSLTKEELLQKVNKILFFAEKTKIEMALKKMKENNIHIAIVVDEYGVIKGFFTKEDIIFELLGEFHEFEKEIVVDGKTRIDDLKEVYGIIFPEGPYETIAGFLIELKGDFPEENEILEFSDYKFQIISRDEKSIKKVKIFR
ncbi:MAG: hemolysin family protein [candidate division WOR-3 bacterium]